ncbi:hypothetical protein [Prevotella sp. HUN102]|uniref:hypothetical protein n=1 Tax=Prevotella sp. HUN102 TaxID=1392486 RepID=UPI00056B711C|nr:hypothetical protein [Prevotella sp. HUN102]
MTIKTSETSVIKRSQINLNPLNPKRHTEEAIKLQKKNLQKIGFLGGIVWNRITGNLIDGHRRVYAMDLLYKYDGRKETDYDIKVEVCELDDKTEKEQLTYMAVGNTKADYDLIAKYANDIDIHNVGLSDSDIKDILSFTDTDIESVTDSIDDLILPPAEEEKPIPLEKTAEEKKQHVKDIKEQVKENAEKRQVDEEAYIMLSFTNSENKQAFCDLFGIDISDKFMKGEKLLEMMD